MGIESILVIYFVDFVSREPLQYGLNEFTPDGRYADANGIIH
jgi:hypothetical protein